MSRSRGTIFGLTWLAASLTLGGKEVMRSQPVRRAVTCKACKRSQFKRCRDCRRKARIAVFPGEGA